MNAYLRLSLTDTDEKTIQIVKDSLVLLSHPVDIVYENADFDISLKKFSHFPVRLGAVLDLIEKEIFHQKYATALTYYSISLNYADSRLTIGPQSYDLSDRERDLMFELLSAGERGCTRDYLLTRIWGYKPELDTHAVETQIYRLRQKIENDPENPAIILTSDSGYCLAQI